MDTERISRVRESLQRSGLDALVCALPSNVLMLSGYWPVTGTAIAVATREGAFGLIAPEDEMEFVHQSWASEIQKFQSGSLDNLDGIAQIVNPLLHEVCKRVGLNSRCSIGLERGASFDPSGYASTMVYGSQIESMLSKAFPSLTLSDATPLVDSLKATLTAVELQTLREGCRIAGDAFVAAASGIADGASEFEIAGSLTTRLSRGVIDGHRSGGFGYCMSGPNSADAYAAYQQSR